METSHAAPCLGMADSVVYTYLSHPTRSAPSNILAPAQQDSCPRWHRTMLGVSGAVNLVLLGAVFMLAFRVPQHPSQNPQTPAVTWSIQSNKLCESSRRFTTCNRTLDTLLPYLKQNLCDPENNSAGGSECKLCPRHWLPHRDKCYWLSNGINYWSRSRDDCARRRSHLLVIQDQEEMEFIQNITDQNPVWIGLSITSPDRKWTWEDGSPLNQTLFTVSGPEEENSCAALRKNRIQPEICNTDLKWICWKAAVLL